MRKGNAIIGNALLCLALTGHASGETLFERELSEEERDNLELHDAYRFFERDPEITAGKIRARYSAVQWPKAVVKVQLHYTSREKNLPPYINQKGYSHVKENQPFVAITCLAKTLFERPITDEERQRYAMSGSSSGYPKGTTMEQVLTKLKNANWGEKTVKVEVQHAHGLIFDKDIYVRPVLKLTYLGEDLILEKARKEWREEAKRRLAIGRDYAGYKYNRLGVTDVGGTSRVIDPRSRVRKVHESFAGPMGYVSVAMHEAAERPVDLHQVAREVIKEDVRLEKTEHGYVIIAADKYRQITDRGGGKRIVWRSGKNLLIYLSALGELPMGLLPLYGGKFPSSVPAHFRIDKDEWGRREMEFWLEYLGNTLDPPEVEEPLRMSFYDAVRTLKGYVFIPLVREWRRQTVKGLSIAEKKAIYGRLVEWWEEARKDAYWHQKRQVLVARGQSPEEIAEKEREGAARTAASDLQARLDVPFTPEDFGRAKGDLVGYMEKRIQRGVESYRKRFAGDQRPVSGGKVEPGKWAWTRPYGQHGTIRETIIGPRIERQEDKRYPMMGTFTIRNTLTFPDQKPDTGIEFEIFLYDKLAGKWSLKSKRRP